jgi:uncharacterized surface protein with fasciclin (FAS1) repeats
MIFVVSCQQEGGKTAQSQSSETKKITKGQSLVKDAESATNILQVAIGSKDHSTLVAGVQAAELEDVLVNAGPLTVFAPNNAAFDALPEGTLETLLKPENKSTLARIIKYHASPGSYDMEKLKDGMQLYQATGHYLKIRKKDGDTFIGDAKILGTVPASNGIVHVIDKVLLPPE